MRWSAIIPDKWKLKFVPSGTSAMDFAHYQSYQSAKLLGSSPPITQVSIFGGLFHFWLNSSGESRNRIMAIIRYIWDDRQRVKSPIVWDFSDISKPGFTAFLLSFKCHIKSNRPFYRYGSHIELIPVKEYYRMPRGHEHVSFVFSSAFWDIFS